MTDSSSYRNSIQSQKMFIRPKHQVDTTKPLLGHYQSARLVNIYGCSTQKYELLWGHLWDPLPTKQIAVSEMLSLSIKLYFLPGFKLVCILLQTKGWRSRSERYIIKMYEAKTLQNRITWLGEVGAGSRECLTVRKLCAHTLTKDILFK